MFETLWLAGMVFANLWGNSLQEPQQGALGGGALGAGIGALAAGPRHANAGKLIGGAIGAGSGAVEVPDGGTVVSGARVLTAKRTEFGPRILQRVPYVNRLFRTVGYSVDGGDFMRVGIDFENPPTVGEQLDARVTDKMPILGPVAAYRARSEDRPTDQEILRAMPKATRGIPYVYEEFRDEIEIKTEKLIDRVDAPCWFPLIGPAQIHHTHWKCTVTFTESINAAYPLPVRVKKRRTEVVYIDKDRIQLCCQQDADNAKSAPQMSCPAGCVGKTTAKRPAIERDFAEASEAPGHPVAAPDILRIEHVGWLALKKPYKLEPTDVISIGRLGDYLRSPQFTISPQGYVNLGQPFGAVRLAGLTEEDAKRRIQRHVSDTLNNSIPVEISVVQTRFQGVEIRGEHLVRPDGTISLGMFGSLYVQGMTLGQVKAAIEKHLTHYVEDPKVAVGRVADPQVIRADYASPRPVAKRSGVTGTTVGDVIRMSKKGVAPSIIIRQMESTGAVFQLSVDDIITLHDAGVCEEVIGAMQDRQTGPSVVPASRKKL